MRACRGCVASFHAAVREIKIIPGAPRLLFSRIRLDHGRCKAWSLLHYEPCQTDFNSWTQSDGDNGGSVASRHGVVAIRVARCARCVRRCEWHKVKIRYSRGRSEAESAGVGGPGWPESPRSARRAVNLLDALCQDGKALCRQGPKNREGQAPTPRLAGFPALAALDRLFTAAGRLDRPAITGSNSEVG